MKTSLCLYPFYRHWKTAIRRLWICVLVCLLSGLPVHAQGVEPPPPAPIVVRVQTPTYDITPAGPVFPGGSPDLLPGAPQLPMQSLTVVLPAQGTWAIQMQDPGSQLLRFDNRIPPAPSPIGQTKAITEDDLPDSLPTFAWADPAIYDRDAFYPPQPVMAGPVQVQDGHRLLALRVYPFQWNPVQGRLRYHPDLEIRVIVTPPPVSGTEGGRISIAETVPQPAATLAGAVWIQTNQRGMHKITSADLAEAGMPLTATDTGSLAMTLQGEAVDIQVVDGGDGRLDAGDYLVFYAEPYSGIYMTHNVYRLTYGGTTVGRRMATRTVYPVSGDPEVTEIYRTVRAETNAEYRSDFVLGPGADRWYDRAVSVNTAAGQPTASRTYALALDDPLSIGTVTLRATLFGALNQPPNPDLGVEIFLNGRTTGVMRWEAGAPVTATVTVPASWLDANPAQLTLQADVAYLPGLSHYLFSPNWVETTYPALADAKDDRLYIQGLAQAVTDRAKVTVTGFSAASGGNVAVYDVRFPRQPVRLTQTQSVSSAGGGYTLSFWDDNLGAGMPPAAYALSAQDALLAPISVTADSPSSWKSTAPDADYIAIVHRSLWDAIQPLLDHRAAQGGLRVAKVDVQDIYDELSHGMVDPEAIRTFLSYAYHNWNHGDDPPGYVLLVGDGHYDFIGASISGQLEKVLIPPYLIQIDPILGETAADNRYVSVDGPDDYLPDMAIGRIPAQTPADLTHMVNKILAYESAPEGDWQTQVTFVAGSATDPDGNFHAFSDDIRLNWLPPGYDDHTIYLGQEASTEAGMKAAVKAAFDRGGLMVQWFGHASVGRWGKVPTLAVADVAGFAPAEVWPTALHLSCLSGLFSYLSTANRNYKTVAETLLLSDQRGTVADIAPTGYHVGQALAVLNRGLVQAIFQERIPRLGDVLDAGKLYFYTHSSAYHDVIDTTVLLGDPALVLRLPAAAQTPDVGIASTNNGGLLLSWGHSEANTGGYEVWRSPQPYFTPGDLGSERLAILPAPLSGSQVSYADSGGEGSVYYAVRGINRVAEFSAPSATVGWFRFFLIPGEGGSP